MPRLLAAKYILPISSEPIENGAVAIEGDQILGVGSRIEIARDFAPAYVEDFGEAAILPGFVNCHSHLELTAMRGALDKVEHDFRSWLLQIQEIRSGMSDEDIKNAAIAGAREGAAAGVTCFADIGRMGHAGVNALKTVGLRGVVHQETEFSPDNRTADEDFLKLTAKYETLREQENGLVKIGISPHATYTVSSRLFELIAQYSIINGVPLSIHAAEAVDEMALLTSGEGFFNEVYEEFGLEWYSPLCSPIEYLDRLGVLSARPLLAHCVHVSESDLKRLSSNGAAVAHCPKSNAKFGHGIAPLEAMMNAGISVGLGSDSVASNNVCDMLEESRFAALAARNHSERKGFVSARDVLKAATLEGARALNLDRLIGSLEPGKQADMAVVSLSNTAQQPVNDIYAALVFASNARDVRMTMVAGKEIHRNFD
jgi:cytosine/adenosine deaminase-related metal-dependent hydrolase